MIVLIDNYDSFSYNLYQLIGSVDPDIKVVRNDVCTVDEIAAMHPRALVLSPGPGRPADAGICEEAVRSLGETMPTLGVCLGHQAICEAFGATIDYAGELMHGKSSPVSLDRTSPLFSDMSSVIEGARYHSLAVREDTLPECLRVTARSDEGDIMAVEHREYPIYGMQFHPESILTPQGAQTIENFLNVKA